MSDSYVDFDLNISANGHTVARSQQGEATAQIATDVPNEIQLALTLIEKRQVNDVLLKKVGESLYNWLFPNSIHTHLQQTEAFARSKQAKIRVRLCIEAESIARLPLELLYRTIGGYYLAINPDTVLSRYLNLPLPQNRARRGDEPLHMVAIISNPTDQSPIDPDEWEKILTTSLEGPLKEGKMTLRTVKKATRKGIRDALKSKNPDIIQFIGHGTFQDGKGYIALVEDDESCRTWLVNEESFANLYMGYDEHLGLISLATCESAQSNDPQAFKGIAPKLVQRGTPAVVAMQYEVLMKTAKIFLEDFYTSVAARKPIDWATQSARNAVSLELSQDNREFITPVLYMRGDNGDIF